MLPLYERNMIRLLLRFRQLYYMLLHQMGGWRGKEAGKGTRNYPIASCSREKWDERRLQRGKKKTNQTYERSGEEDLACGRNLWGHVTYS